MSPRDESMQHYRVLYCPTWCCQPDDEHDFERHRSRPVLYTTADGQDIKARIETSWWENTDDSLIILTTALDEDNDLVLTYRDWAEVIGLVAQMVEADQDPDYIWAYQGAEDDAYGVDEEDDDVIEGEIVDDTFAIEG